MGTQQVGAVVIVGVLNRPGTLLASSDLGELPVCKRSIDIAVVKVWWADGRVTESVCPSWGRCWEVVGGNAHPWNRWEIRSA